jgi:hypothetical protein
MWTPVADGTGRGSTAGRLQAQAEGRRYSTFSPYPPEELRASIATFPARLPSPEVCWVDEHLLVVAAPDTALSAGRRALIKVISFL